MSGDIVYRVIFTFPEIDLDNSSLVSSMELFLKSLIRADDLAIGCTGFTMQGKFSLRDLGDLRFDYEIRLSVQSPVQLLLGDSPEIRQIQKWITQTREVLMENLNKDSGPSILGKWQEAAEDERMTNILAFSLPSETRLENVMKDLEYAVSVIGSKDQITLWV